MKVYIVNKESIAIGDKFTVPLKGFKEEEEAIKYMNLCIEEILRNDPEFRLRVVSDKNKSIYIEDDYWPDGKSFWYIFYISTVEVF